MSLLKDISEVIKNPFPKNTQWRKNLCSIRDLVAKLFIAILAIYALGRGGAVEYPNNGAIVACLFIDRSFSAGV
jgi:hypothetical protein